MNKTRFCAGIAKSKRSRWAAYQAATSSRASAPRMTNKFLCNNRGFKAYLSDCGNALVGNGWIVNPNVAKVDDAADPRR